MERLSTHIKRFIIPYIIVLTGLSLLYTALFSGTSSISQSGDFSFGAFSVLLLGVIIILILRNVIQKRFFKFIIPILIIYCIVLSYKTYNSITTTIAQIELWNNSDKYENKVYVLPKKLDEKVAMLHLEKVGAKLTKLSKDQAEYIGVSEQGPYKPEAYRY